MRKIAINFKTKKVEKEFIKNGLSLKENGRCVENQRIE